MVKLKRFHKDIYYPDWFDNSLDEFTKNLSGKQLICSYHATRKYNNLSRLLKRAVKELLRTVDLELSKEYVFEFYSSESNELKKVCYRFPLMEELGSDIIFVISASGKIVTIFLNRNFDPHVSLNQELYEQGEKENVI